MTQLMLFEPTSATHVTSAVEFARAAAGSDRGSADRGSADRGSAGRGAVASVSAAIPADPDPGMHHMGDLARLVLMRYELVAQRRAAAAARQASFKRAFSS